MTPEELEWRKANGSPLKRVLPMLLGLLGAGLFGGVAMNLVTRIGEAAVEDHARKQAAGIEERCYNSRTHSYTMGPCNTDGSVILGIGFPAAAALLGFVAGFVIGGGKISSAYMKGARELMK
jgi:hypothetical protein